MAADLDIAVCERAINYLLYKASNTRTKFSINLSGQSIQNEQFFKTLMAKLMMNKGLGQRVVFEITESSRITELAMVSNFIETLHKNGYEVCLDDFGAGGMSFQYLQRLNVDYVKVDRQYTQNLLNSNRDAVLLKNLARMCKELDIRVIGERIEEEAQAQKLQELGIEMGQGYYFGQPTVKPEYVQPKTATTVSAG
jgi:EAL domain-containing protein (putative c-di-GMP-specific phosphodiesterase class I)